MLLVEATGSLWSSVIYHALFNGSSSLMAYMVLRNDPMAYADQEVTAELLMYGVGSYLVITAVCLPLAYAVLVWISKHEGREGVFTEMRKKKKDKLITVPLVLALILCLVTMTGLLNAVIVKLFDLLA